MKLNPIRRPVAGLASLLVVGSAVAACSNGSGDSSGSASGGPATITMWAREGDNAIKDELATFQKSHPEITVNLSIVEGSQYLTKLANATRARSVPDLIKFDVVYAPLLATQNQLSDITDKAKALPNFAGLAQAGIDVGTIDSKIYSLPSALTGSQMFWNKKLFKDAGLDPNKPPTTLTEVKAAAQKIQALGGDVHGFSSIGGAGQAFTGFPSGWADGGDVFTAVGRDQKATFSDPHMVAMLQWYQDMWKSGLMPNTDQPNQDPGNVGAQNAAGGKVGIIFSGANLFTGHESDFGSAPGIPGLSGNYASFLGGDMAGITAGAQHPDQAWTLLEWLTTDKQAAQIYLKDGWIAPDLKLANQIATDDWTRSIIGALKVGKLPKSIAYFAAVNDSNGPWPQNSQAVIFKGANVQERMTAAAQQADQLIQDAYRQVNP